jgi:hypothetical protein
VEPTETPMIPGLTLVISPTVGAPGTLIVVTGTKWPAGALVHVSVATGQGRLRSSLRVAQTKVGPDGMLRTRFTFPTDRRWAVLPKVDVVAATADGKVWARTQFTVIARPRLR